MAFGFVPIVHIVTAIFCIIELGLVGYIVNVTNGWWDRANFMLFNSIWSLLVLAYVGITPLYLTRIWHRLASLALLAITTIFWFAGSIAYAVAVRGPYHCGGDSVCGSEEAGVAFGFFIWALFTFLTVLDAIEAMRSRKSGTAETHHKPYVGA